MEAKETPLAATVRVTREVIHAGAHSPLLKYVGYALAIHAVFIALTSVHLLFRAERKPGPAEGTKEEAPAEKGAKPGKAESAPKPEKAPAAKPGKEAPKPAAPAPGAAAQPANGGPRDYNSTRAGQEEKNEIKRAPKSAADMPNPFEGM